MELSLKIGGKTQTSRHPSILEKPRVRFVLKSARFKGRFARTHRSENNRWLFSCFALGHSYHLSLSKYNTATAKVGEREA